MNICKDSVEPPDLEFVTEIEILPQEEIFVVRDKFVFDPAGKNGIKINFVGERFEQAFFTGPSKPHRQTSRRILLCHKLCRSLADGQIFKALGNEGVSILLEDIYYLLSLQGMGEEGPLLVNGSANIFYAFGEDGNLKAIYVRWHEGGWAIGADLVEAERHRGIAGFLVFSEKQG